MPADLIQTVRGLIEPQQLGVTIAHEHLFIDLRCLFDEASDPRSRSIADQPVHAVPRNELVYRPYRSRDNLLLDDEATAAEELLAFRQAGGRSVVDLTVDGIAPDPERLQRLSRQTGVQIIAGAGVYIARAHPAWVHHEPIEAIAERFIHAARDGIAGTNVKAGVFGELGTSSPIEPDEVKVLRAAARAQHATGLSINVHCALWAREGLRALDILAEEDVDLRKVALSHMDELLDIDYHCALAQRGAWLSFDTWGSSFDFGDHREPTDAERLEHLLRMIDAGFGGQILLSHDACTKLNLRRYGGNGLSHLLTDVMPRLQRAGATATMIDELLVANPRRYLSGEISPPCGGPTNQAAR